MAAISTPLDLNSAEEDNITLDEFINRREDAKNFSDYNCNICNTPPKLIHSSVLGKTILTNHKIQHSTNLKTAKAYCTENFPELFL